MSTRVWLSVSLSVLAVALGLLACAVQTHNHARAARLASLQREFEMLDAANAQADAMVSAHVWGVSNAELDVTPKGKAKAARVARGGQP